MRQERAGMSGSSELPLAEAEELMKLCEPGMIDKIRYLVQSGRSCVRS